MAILRVAQSWRRPSAKRRTDRLERLDDEQTVNVGAAMQALKTKLGSWKDLAASIGVSKQTMNRLAHGHTKPSAGLALRLARLAEVPVEDVLSGKYAKAVLCPHCGQVMPATSG